MVTDHFKSADLEDRIQVKAHQLHALLGHACGDSWACFRALSPDLQAGYLETCHDLAETVVDTLVELGKRRLAERDLKAH